MPAIGSDTGLPAACGHQADILLAAGDSIVQQVLGHGLAAKLSAKLGEGVLNGLMTARIGFAAIDVTRPAPFIALEPPKMSQALNVLGAGGKSGEE